jgi:hypothetical protein
MFLRPHFILIVIVTLTSDIVTHAQKRYFNLPPENIDHVLVIQPVSTIYIMGKRTVYDPVTSSFTMENIANGFRTFFPTRIHTVQPDLDTITLQRIYHTAKETDLVLKTKRKKILASGYATIFDSLMNIYHCNYLLVLDHDGYTRTRKQFTKEVALSGTFAFLSGGVFGSPISSKVSSMTCRIYSRSARGVVFHSFSAKLDQDPVEAETTDRQIRQMFEEYFIPKKR